MIIDNDGQEVRGEPRVIYEMVASDELTVRRDHDVIADSYTAPCVENAAPADIRALANLEIMGSEDRRTAEHGASGADPRPEHPQPRSTDPARRHVRAVGIEKGFQHKAPPVLYFPPHRNVDGGR